MNPIRSNFRPVHGASLVPDYSNANRLAMGIAQQIKTEKIQQAEQEEAQQLTQMLSGQRMEEALSNPESRAQWLSLYSKDKDAAAGLMDVWKAGNQLEIQQATAEATEAQHTYETLEGLNLRFGINKSKEYLRQTIIERDVAGKPTDKLKNLLVMAPDDYDAGVQTGKALAGGAVTVLSPAEPYTLSEGGKRFDGNNNLVAENIKPIELEDERPSITELNGINDDVGKLVAPAADVHASALALGGLKKNATATDKIGAVFKFMKALDPTSAVRENEVGMIEGAGGAAAGIAAIWNTAIGEGGMTDKVFQEIVDTAQGLANSAITSATSEVDGYLDAYGDRLPTKRVDSFRKRVPKPFEVNTTAEQLKADAQAAIAAGADPDAVNARLQQALQGS